MMENRLVDDESTTRQRGTETANEIDRVTPMATLWSDVSRRLRDEMTDRNFETWVRPLHPLSWRNAELLIGVRDPAVANYLDLRLRPAIERAAAAIAGVTTRISVVILPS